MTRIRSCNKSHTPQTKIKELIEKNEGLKGTLAGAGQQGALTTNREEAGNGMKIKPGHSALVARPKRRGLKHEQNRRPGASTPGPFTPAKTQLGNQTQTTKAGSAGDTALRSACLLVAQEKMPSMKSRAGYCL
jgi:hypothetical protein